MNETTETAQRNATASEIGVHEAVEDMTAEWDYLPEQPSTGKKIRIVIAGGGFAVTIGCAALTV